MTLADRLSDHKAQMGRQAPEISAVFAAEQADLGAAGLPAGIAAPGTPLPDGDLLDVDGQPTSLGAARDGRPAVVVLYRGAWCPYCNLTLRAYQESLVPVLTERGVPLIAISPQKPDGGRTIRDAHDLTFTVLSDPGNQIAGGLGVLSAERGVAVRGVTAALGGDVRGGNGDGTDRLPMPTTIVVDAAGTIRWIDVHPDYTSRSEPADILAALPTTLPTT
jgi:peroxiredoxin